MIDWKLIDRVGRDSHESSVTSCTISMRERQAWRGYTKKHLADFVQSRSFRSVFYEAWVTDLKVVGVRGNSRHWQTGATLRRYLELCA